MGDSGDAITSVTLINKLDFDNPLYLHSSDTTSGTLIIFIKLKGTENYNIWSRSMLLALGTKNKIDFINGTCVKSTTDNVLAAQWESLWKQYDSLVSSPPCTCGAVACTCASSASIENNNKMLKLMQFLMRLNDVYMSIRSNILLRDPLPDVKVAYAILSREESHRLNSLKDVNNKTQTSAFAVQASNKLNNNNHNNNMSSFNNNNNRGPNPNLKCKKCNKIGHTIERCFEIVGYPPNFKRNFNNNNQNKTFNQNQNNFRSLSNNHAASNEASTSGTSPISFSNEQMLKLLSLINDVPSSAPTSSMSSKEGIFFIGSSKFNLNFNKFFNSNLTQSKHVHNGWIIDSGANQHMTTSSKGLVNVVDISNLNLTVGHPNGTKALIKEIGNLVLNNFITLIDVLVVPEYCVNLMSVNKLSKHNKLIVSFDDSKCFVQDLRDKKIKGIGKEEGGLYIFSNFENECKIKISDNSVNCAASSNLWHMRLGHPSDQVLNVLKTKLNLVNKVNNEPCDICHKAKQSRSSFPLSDHKTSDLGELVHLDLWGPFKVQTKEGFKSFLTMVDDYSRAVWIFLIKTKDEVYDNITYFVQLIETQFHKKVKVFRSDNGIEFINHKLTNFTNSKGIIH
ncbi:uncharacterized protein [Rutidosis leptorrhynchoides]|uniref:uncharacterized protein n=1 Tax=Rutidosis leptorrhynchoides TaxID=125765 RepID=UPI003A9A5323